jgi:G:T-mismatch repair DNA endonuclease (very short patch repair protein)
MSLIISEKNKVRESIRIIKKNIEHSNDTIKRFKSQGASEFIVTQIEKLENSIVSDRNNILVLEKRLSDLEAGILDSEIISQNKENKKTAVLKETTNKKKKDDENKIALEKSKKSKEIDSKNREYERGVKNKEYDMNRAYRYYEKSVESIPDYMLDNLKNMPNNKGYIWKDIYCYGELPSEQNQPITLFEKQRDLLIIHEWSNRYYTIYHKLGKTGRKSIVNRTELKRNKFTSDSLANYFKQK